MPRTTENRREDNATPEDIIPVHVDGKTEQQLMNESQESGTRKSGRASSK